VIKPDFKRFTMEFISGKKPESFHLYCLYGCMYFIMQTSRTLKEAFD